MPLYKRGKSWRYDFVVDGKRHTATLGPISKTRAKEAFEKAKVAAREGRYEEPKKKIPTLKEFFGEYIEYHRSNNRPKSTRRHEVAWTSVSPVFGDKRLSEITPRELERYRRNRRQLGRAEATINRELAFLRNLFNVAIRWGVADYNPMRDVKLAKENNQRVRFLTYEEEERLLGAASPQIKPVIITALNTRFRMGEALSLTWKDVDFQRLIVTVQAAYAKNGESRSIPMNDLLTRTLEGIKAPTGAVFINSRGKPYKDVRRAFESAVKHAEITDFTFHDLRHTFASRLVMAGVDLTTVKELMGHKEISMTLRYAHLSDTHKQRAVALLSTPISTPSHLEQSSGPK